MPHLSPRPTLHDVARAAGVSHMTVSRVVRGSRQVVSATAGKVQRAIECLGYRPDPTLSALAAYRTAGKRTRTSGSILAFLDCDGTPYSRVVLEGARSEAALFGYTMERFVLSGDPVRQTALNKLLFHRGVRGLLFGPSDRAWHLGGWDWKEFATVSLGALSHEPTLHAVAADYFHAAYSGCDLLRQLGCHQVGLIVDARLQTRTGSRWLGGYASWTLENGQKVRWYDGMSLSPRAVGAWLEKQGVDGALTIHPDLAGVLARRGVRAAALNAIGAARSWPFYALDAGGIGREAIRQLHPALLRREFGLPEQARHVALRGEWQPPSGQPAVSAARSSTSAPAVFSRK